MTESERKRILQNIEAAIAEARANDKLDPNAPAAKTGACCLYTEDLIWCRYPMTEKACSELAAKEKLQFKWTEGKRCSEVDCPPKPDPSS